MIHILRNYRKWFSKPGSFPTTLPKCWGFLPNDAKKKGKRASNLTGKKIKIQEDISLKDRSKGKQYSIEKSRGREVIN